MSKLLKPTEVVQAIQDGEKVEFRYPNNDTWHELKIWKNLSLSKLLNSAWQFRYRQEMITVGCVSFPKPESVPPKIGDKYYVATPGSAIFSSYFFWENDCRDKELLKSKLVHLTRDAAAQHGKALVKLSGGQIE